MEGNGKVSQPKLYPVLIMIGVTATLVAAAVTLWQFAAALHAYIIGIGASLAAFLAPLPGLVSPEGKWKWQTAVLIAAVIGLGVWFGANNMASARDTADQRLDYQTRATMLALQQLSQDSCDTFILGATVSMKKQFHDHNLLTVLDIARLIQSLDDTNGHALYYAGEAYLRLRDRINMRDALQHYLAETKQRAEARDGDAAQCYQRPHGYCAERSAWVNHLMANDYRNEANTLSKSQQADVLLTAYRYEHHVIEFRPSGFYRLGSLSSSCEILTEIERRLPPLGIDTREIKQDAKALRCSNAF